MQKNDTGLHEEEQSTKFIVSVNVITFQRYLPRICGAPEHGQTRDMAMTGYSNRRRKTRRHMKQAVQTTPLCVYSGSADVVDLRCTRKM